MPRRRRVTADRVECTPTDILRHRISWLLIVERVRDERDHRLFVAVKVSHRMLLSQCIVLSYVAVILALVVKSRRSFQGRRAVREEFGREPTAIQDGPLLHVLLPPCDGFPGWVEDQVAAIAIELHPVATRLEHVQEQRLGDAVLAGAGLDRDAVFRQDLGGVGDVLGDTIPVAEVMESSPGSGWVAQNGNLVNRRAHAEPGTYLDRATLEEDVLAQTEAELLLHERPRGAHICGHQVDVVEPPHRHAPQGSLLGTVAQRALLLQRHLVVFDIPEQLHGVAGGRGEAIGWAMAAVALTPADAQTPGLDRRDSPLQRLGRSGSPGDMTQARLGGLGHLEGVMVEVFVR